MHGAGTHPLSLMHQIRFSILEEMKCVIGLPLSREAHIGFTCLSVLLSVLSTHEKSSILKFIDIGDDRAGIRK